LSDRPTLPLDWAAAFAFQAIADLETRDILAQTDAKPFARLHFLQMAAEKLCKAYLVDENGIDQLRFHHCIIRKQLPRILEHVLQRTESWRPERRRTKIHALKSLIREIEILCPSCTEADSREDNTEYPWRDSQGKVHVPATHRFAIDESNRKLIELLKLIRKAAELRCATAF
jgi:hypothetical protein